jgi:hypothetical protein
MLQKDARQRQAEGYKTRLEFDYTPLPSRSECPVAEATDI